MEPREPHIRSHEGIVEDRLQSLEEQTRGIESYLEAVLVRLDELIRLMTEQQQRD